MANEPTNRKVFYVSDRTSRTAELNGESLLSQFPTASFSSVRFPFIDSPEKVQSVVRAVQAELAAGHQPPIIFSTLVEPGLREPLLQSGAHLIDLYDTFLTPLEQILQSRANCRVGVVHEGFELPEASDYQRRTAALEFTLTHDDGSHPDHYDRAEVIVVGVSRSAKTPICLYLAMHFFVRAANFPLTGEHLQDEQLPPFLRDKRDRIVGLHINPDRLHAIRQKRRPDSHYASLQNCRQEVRRADEIYKLSGIPVYDCSATSIEEIAVQIVKKMSLLR